MKEFALPFKFNDLKTKLVWMIPPAEMKRVFLYKFLYVNAYLKSHISTNVHPSVIVWPPKFNKKVHSYFHCLHWKTDFKPHIFDNPSIENDPIRISSSKTMLTWMKWMNASAFRCKWKDTFVQAIITFKPLIWRLTDCIYWNCMLWSHIFCKGK